MKLFSRIPRAPKSTTSTRQSGPSPGQTNISSESKYPLECATEAANHQLRSVVTVSTTSSITADTVTSLGGEENAKTFIESVTARFANSFSDELERKLQEACGDPIPLKNTNKNSHGSILDATSPSKEGGTKTVSGRGSMKQSVRHLEDYAEADLPTLQIDSPHDDVDAGIGANLWHEKSIRTSNQDLLEDYEDERSVPSDNGRSDVFSEESGPSRAGVEDLKVVLQRVDEVADDRSYGRVIVPYDPVARPSAQDRTLAPNKHSKWVLTLSRIFRSDNRTLSKTRLDVGSDLILDVLKRLPLSQMAKLESTASLSWPDDDVFRYRDKIRQLALSLGELAVRHVNVLLELIEEEYIDPINEIKELHSNGASSFQILREIYWKGDTVINKQGTHAYRLVDAFIQESERPVGHETKIERKLVIDSVYIDFQGERFGTIKNREIIPEFAGVKYIKDLPRFPLHYHPNAAKVARRLLERGRKFASMGGQRYMVHRGLVPTQERPEDRGHMDYPRRHRNYDEQSSSSEDDSEGDDKGRVPSRKQKGSALQTSVRVVVDAAAFNRQIPYPLKSKSLSKELLDGALTEEHLRICTDEVPVFSLRDKFFYKAPVEEIHDIVFNTQVFGQLVIPESTKDLIRALVESHIKESNVDDFVEGKGKGLVILLHGPPGVGKTMTAEAVAEHTRRPLYAVTSGELGETAGQLERNLRTVLDRAKSFRAVLLLDEADVFVEERKPQDLGRNALVSIFLRELEYYQGIMVLTTNRAQTFDHAFQSRIHVSIGYSELDVKARERIWRAFGDHVAGGLHIAETDYAELAGWNLNGRQIKNIVSSAKALASSRSDDLTMVYLRIVKDIVGNSHDGIV